MTFGGDLAAAYDGGFSARWLGECALSLTQMCSVTHEPPATPVRTELLHTPLTQLS